MRFSPLSVLSVALLVASSAIAQQATPAVRIVNPIDEKQLVTIKGTMHPLANAKNDRGAAPDEMQLDRMHLVLKRSNAQENSLRQTIADLHAPGNPSYHKWLTPDEFGKQFGPSDQDVATVETWLTGHGFSIAQVNPGRQTIEFAGSVKQFRSAFHAQIHKYAVNGETHYANAQDPQIPAALSPVVGGFVSLNNFHAQSYVKYLGKAQYDPKTDHATPEWTIGNSTSGYNFVLAPQDYAVQYDLPAATTGTGQTIAIINDSNINIGLVNQFRSLFSLPANPPQVIIDGNDPGVNGDSVEAYLDVEWAGAVAPNATIDLVIGADTPTEYGLYLAAEHAVYGNIAPVMSMSFGNCESQLGSTNTFIDSLWEQAAAQGITVMVSTGDSGSAGCDSSGAEYATLGQAVNGLGSTPYNVAVGGTDFYYGPVSQGQTAFENKMATYWSETPSNSTPAVSIKGVIPEQPWNDSPYGQTLSTLFEGSSPLSQTSIAGGSGGSSSIYTTAPAWQTGFGDGKRDLPDVSLFASNGSNASYYPLCAVDGDCQAVSSGNTVQISGVGGTSASSPAFAGIMALVNQKWGRQGQANFVLYPLSKSFPAAFHDVANGTNTVSCDLTDATLNCVAAPNPITLQYLDSSGNTVTILEGMIGTGTTPWYNAVAGYDEASGLGTVDASVLINDWNKVAFTSTATTLTPSQTSFTHGTAITITGGVTGSPTPTGDVALMTDSTEPLQQGQGIFTLTTGGTFNVSVDTLPGGTYNIWGMYGGDTKNGESSSTPVPITVNPENSGIYFSIHSPTVTYTAASNPGTSVDYGTQFNLSAIVAPSSDTTCLGGGACSGFSLPTGTVQFKDGTTAINTAVINSEGDAEYKAPFSVNTHSVTASYAGDNSYNASPAVSPITFTVVKDNPTITPSISIQDSSNGDLVNGPNQPTVWTVAVENTAQLNSGAPGPAAAPTGSVSVSSNPALSGMSGSATLSPAVDPLSGAVEGVATFTVPAGTVAGSYSVTMTYSPGADPNYNSATATYPIVIENTNSFGLLNSSITGNVSGSISPTTSVTISGTVTGQSGHPAPTGGVWVYSSGNNPTAVGLSTGGGDSSTYLITLNSQTLFQGSNQITLQYFGDTVYNPAAIVLTNPISNPLSDFSLIPATTIEPVTPGGSGTVNVNLASVNGFSGPVSLTCTPSSVVTCTIPASETLASGGSATAALKISAASGAASGPYNVLITGRDSTGKYIHTTAVQAVVAVTAPGFALTNSGNVTVNPGATTGNTSTISVSPSGGFTGTVDLSCAVTTTPPSPTSPATCGIAASVNITGTSAATATLTVGSTATTTPGAYAITVTGKDAATGKISSTTVVDVTVNAPGFALTNNGPISLVAGATTGNTSTITVTPSNGFTGAVNLTCLLTNPPGGIVAPTCTVTPSVTISGTTAATGTLTIDTTSSTTPGSYTMTVTGTDVATGKITSSTAVGLTVNPPPSFALSNSGAISFQAGATTGNIVTITVTPAGGFTGVVDLVCAVTTTPANPTSPTTCSVTATVDPVSANPVATTLTANTTLTTSPGNYSITVTGKDHATGTISSTTTVTATVTAPPPPAIALSNNGALSFIAGAVTGNSGTITVTPSNGFTGNVNLTCAVTPAAAVSPATCAASPTPVDITGTGAKTATLTVTTTATTTPGSYTATVTGKDAATGNVTSSTAVSVTVLGVPGFGLTNNGPITFGAGLVAGNTATITVTPVNSFTASVALACAVTTMPTSPTSPATCSLASGTVAGGAGTDVLTIATTSTTTPGSYSVTVTGTSGTITEITVVSITVNASYSATAGTVTPASVSPGSSATSTITVASVDGYAGALTVTCAQTSGPSNTAGDAPVCSGGTATLSSGTQSATATATVTTTAASTSELVYPKMNGPKVNGKGGGWLGAGGGAVLALLVFFGIPARRRNWRAMLGVLMLMAALGSLSACGGGGGGCTSNCGGGNPGTAAGNYVFTVTATGNPVQSSGNTTTFTLTVN